MAYIYVFFIIDSGSCFNALSHIMSHITSSIFNPSSLFTAYRTHTHTHHCSDVIFFNDAEWRIKMEIKFHTLPFNIQPDNKYSTLLFYFFQCDIYFIIFTHMSEYKINKILLRWCVGGCTLLLFVLFTLARTRHQKI